MPVPSSMGYMQPSFCQGNHQFKNQGEMRAGEFGLAYTPLAVLLPWPGSPASPARAFLLSHNNYLKMLKFLATSGDTSRSQGIHCHIQFPIPHPEPVWLKPVQFCASFCHGNHNHVILLTRKGRGTLGALHRLRESEWQACFSHVLNKSPHYTCEENYN